MHMQVLAFTAPSGALPLRRPPQRTIGVSVSREKLLSGSSLVCRTPPRASKADNLGPNSAGLPGAAAPPPPYSEALLAREYELWQRQAAMYERLLEQADREQQRFAQERAAWQATEAALRQEAAELRAQLLYVLAQLNTLQQAGVGMATTPLQQPSPGSYVSSSQQAAIAGREPAAALPSSSSSIASTAGSLSVGLSGAEQVKAVMDAMKAGAGPSAPQPAAHATPAGAASSNAISSSVDPAAAWPAGADSELPAYAADLAAAVAAVDTTDVLSGVGSFQLAERQAAAQSSIARSTTELAAAAAAPKEPAATAEPPVAAAAAGPEQPSAEAAAGPPPALTLGADDIFWVNQLHTALVDMGYYPGDEDIDDFFFGEGTMSALMTMQCCEGLPETGITDEATWAKLLGPELRAKVSRDLTADMMVNVPGLSFLSGGTKDDTEPSSSSSSSSAQQQADSATSKPAYAELFTAAFSETVQPNGRGGVEDVQQLSITDTVAAGGKVVSDSVTLTQRVEVSHQEVLTEWPVLHEGDGGREVHALHVALERAGFYPSEDDVRWWSFGDGTVNAIKTFQACNGYPESGVCDAATWRFLMGPDASPQDIFELRSGDSADEDLSAQDTDRVWLIGEQRWEDRSRLRRS